MSAPQTLTTATTTLTRTPRLYPAYCFRRSPTFNNWVKLFASTLQSLRLEPNFSSQRGVYFHLNHPIRWVRLVGVVVAIDDITAKYTSLTLDDGSGATVEVKIVRLLSGDMRTSVESASNTTVENMNVVSKLGVFDVVVDGEVVDIGTVVKVKGTITEWRGMKQVEVRRIGIAKTTDSEARSWEEAARFKREVLDVPWHISKDEHRKIKAEIKAEKKMNREYERQQAAYEEKKRKHEEKEREHRRAFEEYMAKRDVKLEQRRRKEEVMMNAGALI